MAVGIFLDSQLSNSREYKNYITGIMTKSPIYVIVNTG